MGRPKLSVGGLQIVGTTTEEMIEQAMPEEAREAKAAEKAAKKSHQASLDAKIGQAELAGSIARVYNLVARFGFHDDIRFEASDCQEESEGLLALINRFPQARIVLRLIAPLGAVAAMIEKVETLIQRKRERDNVQPQPGSNQPA